MAERDRQGKQQSEKVTTVVVRRSKHHDEHAHHGGAWKIAYADFVTAMMAFFLLMWLLGSTSKFEKQGIEDYFNTPLSSMLGGKDGNGAICRIRGLAKARRVRRSRLRQRSRCSW
jgi:chemotaxis protein MotB